MSQSFISMLKHSNTLFNSVIAHIRTQSYAHANTFLPTVQQLFFFLSFHLILFCPCQNCKSERTRANDYKQMLTFDWIQYTSNTNDDRRKSWWDRSSSLRFFIIILTRRWQHQRIHLPFTRLKSYRELLLSGQIVINTVCVCSFESWMRNTRIILWQTIAYMSR